MTLSRSSPDSLARMSIRRLAAPIALLVLLAACTEQAAAPVPVPEPDPTGTATAVDSVRPDSVVDAPCASLVPALDLEALVPGAVLAVDESSPTAGGHAEYPQANVRICNWKLDGWTAFSLRIAPATVAEYLDARYPVVDRQYSEIDRLGDRSVLTCSDWGCNYDIAVAGVWMSGWASPGTVSDDQLLRRQLHRVLTTTTAVVEQTARDVAAWEPGPGEAPGWGLCGRPFLDALAPAIGAARLDSTGDGVGDGFTGLVWKRIGVSHCIGSEVDRYVAITFIPGAAWAFEGYVETPPAYEGDLPAHHDVEQVDGIGEVLVGCPYEACIAYLVDRGGLLSISASLSASELLERLPAIVAAVHEHG